MPALLTGGEIEGKKACFQDLTTFPSLSKYKYYFFKKRGVPAKLFRLADRDGDGRVGMDELMEFLIMFSKSRCTRRK